MRRNAPTSTDSSIRILGIGNYLMGDEGVGVHAAQQLEQKEWPDDIEWMDGGTGGFHLLSYITDCKRLILIDATRDGKSKGTVSVLYPRFASDYPNALSAHDIGLRDLIESAMFTGKMPETILITISIDEIQEMTTDLSNEVASSIHTIEKEICRLINDWPQSRES